MSTLQRLFKHTFIYGLATVLPKLVNVFLNYLLAAYLPGNTEFGETGIIFSYIIFANVIFSYGMETSFFRFYNDEHAKEKVIGTSLWSVLLSTIAIGALWWCFLPEWSDFTDISVSYWRWVILLVVVDALMVVPFAILRACGQSKKYAVIKVVNTLIAVLTTLLFFTVLPQQSEWQLWLPEDRIELYLIAMCAASCVTLLLIVRPYFNRNPFDFKIWTKMLHYGWPILLAGLAFAVNETFDKILLQYLLPFDVAQNKALSGMYTAGYRLAIGMTLFAQAFRLGVEPFFFSQSGDKNAPYQYAMITKTFVALGAVALLLYIVMVDFLKPYLLSDMETAIEIVPVILVAYFFSGIYQSLSVWYKIKDKTFYGAVISVIAAVITILINVLFIPHLGYVASAYATLTAYGIMMGISYKLGKKHIDIPYDFKGIALYLGLSILLSFTYFYYFRPLLGIESLSAYALGFVMVVGMLLLLRFRESELIKNTFKKWK